MGGTKDRITLRLGEDLRSKLEVIAEEETRTLSNLVQVILQDYVKEKEREIQMTTKEKIMQAMEKIISDYDKMDKVIIRKMLKHVDEDLKSTVGYWGFLYKYVPKELWGKEDENEEGPIVEMSSAEKAIVRAAQVYIFHRRMVDEEVHTGDETPYLMTLLKTVTVKLADRDDLPGRLGKVMENPGEDTHITRELIYFIKITKGNFKADYTRLAVDLWSGMEGTGHNMWV